MAGEQDLKLRVSQDGAEETAAAVGKVETAQKKVAGTAVESAAATETATEATKKAAASNEDLFNILNKIHPGLGEIAQTMSRGSKVAGDFATKNIELANVFGSLKTAVTENAGALKLLLAGGAVAIGIGLIGAAVAKMKAEFEEATKAINDNAKALDELRGKQIEEQASIEQIADARKRVAPITPEQSSEALARAEAVRARLPELGDGSIRRAAGVTAGLDGVDQDMVEQLAILLDRRPNFKLNGDADADSIRRQIQQGVTREAPFIEGFRQRETRQGAGLGTGRLPGGTEAEDRARRQAVAAGGETNELKGFASTRVNPGTDLDRLTQLAQKFGSVGALEDALKNPGLGPGSSVQSGDGNVSVPTQDKTPFGLTEYVTLSRKDVADLTAVLGDLSRDVRANSEATRQNSVATPVSNNGRFGPARNGQNTLNQP